jgi:uncharacterized protein YndB with AHSA1/START domain
MESNDKPSAEQAHAFDIVSRRSFDAPRTLLYEAFRNPNHLVHWWGPNGFTNTFHEFDLRPGGTWRFTMHGSNGVDYEIMKKFLDVVDGDHIVLEHVEPMHHFRLTMTFTDDGPRSELIWHMVFLEAEESDQLKRFLAEANEQNFDRLEAYLPTMKP